MQEHRESGFINKKVINSYIKASDIYFVIIYLGTNILMIIIRIGIDFCLRR